MPKLQVTEHSVCFLDGRRFMFRSGRSGSILLVFFLAMFTAFESKSQNSLQVDGVKVIRSDPGGMVFSLSTDGLEVSDQLIGGKRYQAIRLDQAVSPSGPGDPDLPYFNLVIGVPADAEISVSFVPGAFDEFENTRVVPVRLFTLQDHSVIESDVYSENRFLPEKAVMFDPPSFFRNVKTAVIKVCPVQYNPVAGRLRVCREMQVKVDFLHSPSLGGKVSLMEKAEPGFDGLLKGMLLNYQQAKQWGVRIKKQAWKSKRAAAEGTWLKIPITEEGIYRLDRNFFEKVGVDVSTLDPRTIKIFNNFGNPQPLLPAGLDLSNPSEPQGVEGLALIENAIYVEGESDGIFNNADFVLFYGRGPSGWDYDAATGTYVNFNNPFTTENTYWLSFDGAPGKRMEVKPFGNGSATVQTTFRSRIHHEKDRINFFKSGLVWIDDTAPKLKGPFTKLDDYPPTPDLPAGGLIPDIVDNTGMVYRMKLNGMSNEGEQHRITISVNGIQIADSGPFSLSFANAVSRIFTNSTLLSGQVGDGRVSVSYSSTKQEGEAGIDWLEVEFDRHLRLDEGTLTIYSPGLGGVYEYRVSSVGTSVGNLYVFDITDLANPARMTVTQAGADIAFKDVVLSGTPKTYFASDKNAIKAVQAEAVVIDQNSDLVNTSNRADYLIITHGDFREQADRLASYRGQADGYSTMVVDIQDIFDEFGAGNPDPFAVRDFLRYVYYRWATPNEFDRLKYVVLMGDGNFDYKGILADGEQRSWMLTRQIHDAGTWPGHFLWTRSSDESFAYLNDTGVTFTFDATVRYEQLGPGSTADVFIGRMPVRSPAQADHVIDKIIFMDSSPFEYWKNRIVLAADDEIKGAIGSGNETLHTDQTDRLFKENLDDVVDVIQIYLMDYPYEFEGGRIVRKKAQKDFIDNINKGAFVVNYVGHGSPSQLAHEELYLESSDIQLLQNKERYFMFVGATCNFAHFDLVDQESSAELMLNARERGAFAIISAVRPVLAGDNFRLAKEVYNLMYNGLNLRLGEVFEGGRIAASSSFVNDQKYHLLGDPAMNLFNPDYNVSVTVGGPGSPDTLKALSEFLVTGMVTDGAGNPLSGFDGEALITVYDRQTNKRLECLSGNCSETVTKTGRVLYRGLTDVTGGQFSQLFFVPKDISYSLEPGKVVAYVFNEKDRKAGFSKDLVIDQSIGAAASDESGPGILIESASGKSLTDGAFTPENPLLVLAASDEHGINVTNSLGHGIELIVDEQEVFGLSEHFVFDRNSLSSGKAKVRLSGIEPGEHLITAKAWDAFNNLSTYKTTINVVETGDGDDGTRIKLSNCFNYPNPFSYSQETRFSFVMNHESADYEIKIYTIAGRLIRKLKGSTGEIQTEIQWDGRDADGDKLANGVYVYKIRVKSLIDGSKDHVVDKLVVSN